MAVSDAQDMYVDICDWVGTERANAVAQITQLATLRAELDVLASGTPALDKINAAINSARQQYVRNMKLGAIMFDVCFGYWGQQLTVPSVWTTKAGLPANRRFLMKDINAQMVTDDHDVGSRAKSWASEPTADDDGIIDRLTVDENGITIEGGYSATIEAKVQSIPSQYRSILRIQGRSKTNDVLDLKGPEGYIDIEAVNGAGGRNLVTNPNLTNPNSTTDEADVTSLLGWTLSDQAGSPTHKIDTDIAYRGLSFSHKLYGNSTTRRFEQPLIVASGDRDTPRNYMLAVYKTGTPVGNITVTWGGNNQVFTMGGLSSGWNYLRLDRDSDLFPTNFGSSGMVLRVDFAFTSGSDSSNYINIAYIGGQNLRRYNAAWYGHWSRNGIATQDDIKTFADTDDAGGKNQSATFYAYEGTPDRDFMYLRHINDASETIADYS